MEGIATLDKSISLLREENSQGLMELTNKTEENTQSTESLHKTVGDLLKEFRGSRLDALEEKREQKSKGGEDKEDQKKVSGKTEDDSGLSDLMLFGTANIATKVLGVLAAIPVAATAFAGGFVEGWVKTLGQIGKAVRATISGITKVVMKPVNLLVRAIKALARPFANLATVFEAGVDGTRPLVRSANGTFRSLSSMEKLFLRLGKTFSGMVKLIRAVVSSVSRIPQLITSLFGAMRSIGTSLSTIPKMITERLGKVTGFITKSINGFFNVFRRIGTRIGSIGSSTGGMIKGIFSPITKAIDGFFDAWRSVAGVTKTATQSTSGISKLFSPITKAINGIKTAIQGFGSRLGGIFRLFGTLGRFIAFPVTIIMGIIDGFKGFMRGWEEQEGIFNKLIAGALGAIGGVARGIIGIPLDLLKSAVGFIASKLGFENFAEMLESFSFANLIQDIFDSVTDVVLGIKDGIVQIFKDIQEEGIVGALANLGSSVIEGIKSMLRKVIPDQDSFLGGFIPDGIYEFLDEPPPERSEVKIGDSQRQPETPERQESLSSEEEDELNQKLAELNKREKELIQRTRENEDEIKSDPAKLRQVQRQMQDISAERLEIEQKLRPVEGRNEDIPRVATREPEPTETRQRPERPDFSQRQMANAQLTVAERERRDVEQKSMVNAVDASQRVVNNNNNVNNNQTALINNNMPATDNLDRTWGW